MKQTAALAFALAAATAYSAYAEPQATAPPPCKSGPVRPVPPGIGYSPAIANNLAKAKAFLAENAKQPGVVSLPSGAQYKVLASGAADASCATLKDRIRISYQGTLPDGSVFDQTKEGSTSVFPLSALIPGWQHVVPMMRLGDEWMIYLPPSLGYGEQGAPGLIPPNSALIFRMKLIGIM